MNLRKPNTTNHHTADSDKEITKENDKKSNWMLDKLYLESYLTIILLYT